MRSEHSCNQGRSSGRGAGTLSSKGSKDGSQVRPVACYCNYMYIYRGCTENDVTMIEERLRLLRLFT
jgi:hypothetical protein